MTTAANIDEETRGARILVVDDHVGNRELLRAILDDAEYHPVVFGSGRAALDSGAIESCELALIDLRMPGMDGFELLAAIRARPGGVDIPVVFVTAHDELEVHERALQSGVDDFLLKPTRPTELVIRVRSLLRLRRTRQALERTVQTLARGNEQLEQARVARRALASRVMHDLRNPLQGALLGAHLLGHLLQSSDEATEIVDSIERAIRQMRRLVVDLADVERGNDGILQANLQVVAIDRVLESLRSLPMLGVEGAAVDVRLRAEPALVSADPALLRRVLVNLLEHSVANAPTGTEVRVTVRAESEVVRVGIADEGPGLSSEARRGLFERLAPFDGSEGGRTVASLGLVYCGLAAQAMNGSLSALDGERGIGLAFELVLPRVHDASLGVVP